MRETGLCFVGVGGEGEDKAIPRGFFFQAFARINENPQKGRANYMALVR